LHFGTTTEVDLFYTLVEMIHDKNYKVGTEIVHQLIKFASRYRNVVVIKRCAKSLESQEFKDPETAFIYLDVPDFVKSCPGIGAFIEKAANFLVKEFQNFYSISLSDDKKRFYGITNNAMLEIIKHDELLIDSEDTLFYLLIVWTFEDRSKWISIFILLQLIGHIRFSQMNKYFLLDIVPLIAGIFVNAVVRKKILMNRMLALELKVGGSRRLIQLQSLPNSSWLKPRIYRKKLNLTEYFDREALESLFGDGNRLFSKQQVFCGYQFYFIICLDNTTGSIVLYVRCTSHIIRKMKHYLPAMITVKNEKKETDTKLVFEDSSVALRSTKALFDGKKISEILNDMDNRVEISVDIELLDSDAGCGRCDKRNTSQS